MMDDKKTIERNVKTILDMTHSADFECYDMGYDLVIIKANGKACLLALKDEHSLKDDNKIIPELIGNTRDGNNQNELFELVKKHYQEHNIDKYAKGISRIEKKLRNKKLTSDEQFFISTWVNVFHNTLLKEIKIGKLSQYFLLDLLISYQTDKKTGLVLYLGNEKSNYIGWDGNIKKVKEVEIHVENKIDIKLDVTPQNVFDKIEDVIKNILS